MEYDPIRFWDLTYAEYEMMSIGYTKRQRRQSNERMTQAYNIATLMRMRKMPDIQALLLEVDPQELPPEQTDEQMFVRIQMINVAWGGVVEEQE